MILIHKILTICSLLSVLFGFILVVSLLGELFGLVFRKKPIDLGSLNIFHYNLKFAVPCSFIVVFGVLNIILSSTMASTTIGDFYEKGYYEQEYEATLYIDEKAIFCIANVLHTGDGYFITEVHLPYGKSQYVNDAEYNILMDKCSVSLGVGGDSCNIVLRSPVSNTSYDVLNSTVVSSNGEFCASRQSDIFHFSDCIYVKTIKRENLIFFDTDKEANVFGFSICNYCNRL